jgi:WD40 repeat protein
VSYSRRDAAAVLAIVRAAEAGGRSLWVDADNIPPAAPWRTELGTAIEAADAVVCCLSPDWVRSTECRREYERAVELGKRLVPILLRDTDGVPEGLTLLQWIDARDGRDPEEVAASMLAAIDTDHERVREHTHWLSRAVRWDARGNDRSLLLRGRDLRAAEEWLARPGVDPSPTPLQTRFIVASRQAERRRLRTTLAAALTAVVVSLGLAAATLVARAEAVRQRDQAQSRALAAAAVGQLDVDPELSLLLAREAWGTAPTDQALSALRAAVDRSRVRVSIDAHPTAVSGVAWSADGKLVFSAGRDGVVRAWEAVGGKPRGEVRLGHGAAERLHVDAAGRIGVAVTDAGRAALWRVEPTGTLQPVAVLASEGIGDVTVSEDGRRVVAGTAGGRARAWDPAGRGVEDLGARHDGRVLSVAVSTDGRTVLTGGADGAAVVSRPGVASPARIASYGTAVSTTELSADGSLALTSAEDGTGSVRRVKDGSLVVRLERVFVAAMDRAGAYVATSDVDGRVVLKGLKNRRTVELQGPGSPVRDLEFSTDGNRLVAGGIDGVTRIWQVVDGTLLGELRGGARTVSRTALSPDAQRVLTGHGDGSLRIWDLPPQPVKLELEEDLLDLPSELEFHIEATSVAFSPDGRTVLTASRDGLARTWDARTGKEVASGARCQVPPMGPECLALKTYGMQGLWLTDAAYSPDGRRIATSGQHGSVVVWDAATAEQVARAPDVSVPVDDVAFSPDGELLAVAGRNGGARLIDVATGRVRSELRGSDRHVYAVALTADGQRVLTADDAGIIRGWSLDGTPQGTFAETDQGILALAVDPGGRLMAAAGDDQVVLLDQRDGHRVMMLSGHAGLISTVAFSPDGSLVMSGGLDGTLRVWDVRSGDQAALFRLPGGAVSDVDVDPSGRWIAAATPASAAYVVACQVCTTGTELARLADAHATRELDPEERSRFGIS